jgi:putrescine transport system substrate-binding protein
MRFLTALLIAAFAAPASGEEVVNVYNWADYIAPEVLERFEAETGIRVVYDVYDSNEMLEAKLLTGASGYDVVFPSARPYAARHLKRGTYLELDRVQLPHFVNLDATLLASLEDIDPGNRHLAPYTWGTTGIGYDRRELTMRLGGDAPADTWALLFDPEVAAKMASCGISVLDDPEEFLRALLIYLGRKPESAAAADLDAAVTVFARVRPFVRYFHSSQYLNDLASGDLCLSMGFSGDVLQARDRAVEARNGVDIAYVVPREGAGMWMDTMAVPADAPHRRNAHAFVDYILRAETMAAITNHIHYANANRASFAPLDRAVRDDPGIYPSAEVMKRLVPATVLKAADRRARSRAYMRLKTGK